MTDKVVGLDGGGIHIDPDRVADVVDVCERGKALREVVVVGRTHDGDVYVSGSMASPCEALWMLQAGITWFMLGDGVTIAQCREPEEKT